MDELRILLADDDAEHRELLGLALQRGRRSVRIHSVGTPGEFIELVRTQQYDCVVVDFNFKPRRADELLIEVADSLASCPVVVISSSEDQAVVIAALRAGVTDLLPKIEALTDGALLTRIERAVAESRRSVADRRTHQRREEELAALAETDALTGLFNRRHLERLVQSDRFRKDRRRHLCVVMMDIDHFKQINDTMGHAAGDEVIRAVAGVLRQSLSPSDSAIRWGGEEFLAIRPSSDTADTWLWAERLRHGIADARVIVGGQRVNVTVSIGIARLNIEDFGEEAINLADHAMYLAKERGRNRVCTWEMVAMERAAEQVALDLKPEVDTCSPRQLRDRFLTRCQSWLGPTQTQHVREHGNLVAACARRIARRLGGRTSIVESAENLALLHDLGKCVVPESLLNKPTGLHVGEWNIVHRSGEEGAILAQRLGVGESIVELVRTQGVRFDAAEIMRVAAGENELCHRMESRVVQVADAFVSMTTPSAYRAARSAKEAVKELIRGKGRQFDPDCVDAIAQMVAAGTSDSEGDAGLSSMSAA